MRRRDEMRPTHLTSTAWASAGTSRFLGETRMGRGAEGTDTLGGHQYTCKEREGFTNTTEQGGVLFALSAVLAASTTAWWGASVASEASTAALRERAGARARLKKSEQSTQRRRQGSRCTWTCGQPCYADLILRCDGVLRADNKATGSRES